MAPHCWIDPLIARFAWEHDRLQTVRASVRQEADALYPSPGPSTDAAVRRGLDLLVEHILPHEYAEESQLYPVLVD
ncbi:hypothetical protein ACQPZ2_22370 [Nocardia pseudovaccinii]|uniref:hypothetical protein n=1 Tax=Nocardia pseudovaccinii TaxID=189540 RepID=UPI003D89D924